MYKNIGKKIKGLAKATFIVEAISAVITGMILGIVWYSWGEYEGAFVALGIMVGGPIIAWVSTWLLYGFGELVDKTSKISDKICPEEDSEGED